MSDESVYAIFSHPENGRSVERIEANNILVVGKKYAVERISVFPYSTDVYLKGIDSKFNSVFFDFEKDGKAYDPTKDKENWTWQSQKYGG